jgi:sigma-B regulation protein RsbU (phosphoserine phosphatase)
MNPDQAPTYEELYEDAPCGCLSADADGRIVHCNRTLLGWLGYEAGEVIGRLGWPDLLSVGGRIYYETHYAPLLRLHGEAHEVAFDLVTRAGERQPVLVTTRRTTRSSSPLWQSVVFAAAERRAYEKELTRKNDDLRQALGQVKTLRGLIPICSSCHQVRTEADTWIGLEAWVEARTEARFSHGICPSCQADYLKTLPPRR